MVPPLSAPSTTRLPGPPPSPGPTIMIPRLQKVIQDFQVVVAATTEGPSELAPAERPQDNEHGDTSASTSADESEKRKPPPMRLLRPSHFDVGTPGTVLGGDFGFMKISSPTELRHRHEGASGSQRHLAPTMIPREESVNARHGRADKEKSKAPSDGAAFNPFFLGTTVEDYRRGGIVLPEIPPSTIGTTEEKESEDKENLAEESDSELIRQKAEFERTVEELKTQRDSLLASNSTLQSSLAQLRTKLELTEAGAQHLLSERKRLDNLLAHAHNVAVQHHHESATLRSSIQALESSIKTLGEERKERDRAVRELEARCGELDKKIVSLTTLLTEETRRTDKEANKRLGLATTVAGAGSKDDAGLTRTQGERKAAKYQDTEEEFEHKKLMEAMEKKNAELEVEIQRLKASLKDLEAKRSRRNGERSTEEDDCTTAVESEFPETPDKSRMHVLGKRRSESDAVDSTEPLEKKSRPGTLDYSAESTRGRSKIRALGRRIFKGSLSRTRTPERFAPPPPVAFVSSAGSSNNADDEASVAGDNVQSSPPGVGGTPRIAISTIDDSESYVFVDPVPSGADPQTKFPKNNESRWKIRSPSRERPATSLHIPAEPVSPTPVGTKRYRSPTPLSPPHRPVQIHAATDSLAFMSRRALSPPGRAVTSPGPVHQKTTASTASSSKKRKQDVDVDDEPTIESYYAEGGETAGRRAKRNRM